MRCAYFVWTDRIRLPSVADLTAKLSESGLNCRVSQLASDSHTSAHWARLELEAETSSGRETCTVSVTVPSIEEIDELRQTYDSLPFQVKNAARKYKIEAEGDDYGQARDFQLRVIARLTNGVVDDPQEHGLMVLAEFEDLIA